MKMSFVVEPVLFFTFMTMYMEVSLVQQLFNEKVCVRLGYRPHECDNKTHAEVTHETTSWFSAYNTELSLITLVTSLWFGSWADKYGRKKLMILPSIGSIASTINFIFSSYFMEVSPVALMVSAALIGVSTGTLGASSTCFGLVSDVTSVDKRSTRMAIMEAMIFTGGSLGLYFVGFVLPRLGYVATFSFELVIHISILCYIIFIVREPQRPHQLSTSSVFSLNHVLSMVRTVFRPREQNYRLVVILLLFASLMLSFGLAATAYLTFTFLRASPLSWTGSDYSFYHGLLVAIQGFAIVLGLPMCLRIFRMKDTTAGFLGTLSRLVGLAWLSASTKSWMVYLTLLFLSLSEFAVPSVRSLLSKIVGPNEKAQVFAFMNALQSLAFLIVSLLFLGLYSKASEALFPGFGFAIAAVLQLVPLIVFIYLHFALDLNTLSTPLCTEPEAARYDSTEDSVNSVHVS